MSMNELGYLMRLHWERERPQELMQITDPDRFFTDLGEEIEADIQRRVDAEEYRTQDQISEDYLANLAHLTTLRARIEGEVLEEHFRIDRITQEQTQT